jgi:hypothetical protein
MPLPADITSYNSSQTIDYRAICELLALEITSRLPNAESKVWHGAPVWFLDGNPVVGYWVRKDNVQLLFWSGQTFNEPGLTAEGKFKAAEARYTNKLEIDLGDLHRWLKKSVDMQWDYKNIVKRRGELVRLK